MKTSFWLVLATLAATSAIADPATYRLLGHNEKGMLVFERPLDQARVVWIPAGEFRQLGYAPKASDEIPHQTRQVPGFAMDETEVTNRQFARFLEAHGGDRDDDGRLLVKSVLNGLEQVDGKWWPRSGMEELPALGVTGFGAVAYAEWVGAALPSLAEWQKASSGPAGRVFPWGDAAPDASHANFRAVGPDMPAPVGSSREGASPFGLFDMAGNAYERVFAPGRSAPVVIRGGSWASPHPLNLRTLDMCVMPMGVADRTVGFRCVARQGAGLPGSTEERISMESSELGSRLAPRPDAAPSPESPPKQKVLRLARSWKEARQEALERNCPILVSMHYDTCGQCDRTKVGLFEDPEFVEHFNTNAVVVVGQFAWDAEDKPHAAAADGSCPYLPGVTCEEHLDLWLELYDLVGGFQFSPGMFIVDPRVPDDGYPDERILIPEKDLPKWGGDTATYIERLTEAQRLMDR